MFKALSDGHAVFTRIVVVADTESPTPPCGPCRQMLWEFCGDIDVILANLEQTTATLRLSELAAAAVRRQTARIVHPCFRLSIGKATRS